MLRIVKIKHEIKYVKQRELTMSLKRKAEMFSASISCSDEPFCLLVLSCGQCVFQFHSPLLEEQKKTKSKKKNPTN